MKEDTEHFKGQKGARSLDGGRDWLFHFNYIFAFVMALVMSGYLIYTLATHSAEGRFFPIFGVALLCFGAGVLEIVFRRLLTNFVSLFVNIYILFAGVVGAGFQVYNLISWYDILVHFVCGYVSSVGGLFLLVKLGDYLKVRAVTVVIFCVSVALLVAGIWEIMEFATDNWIGHTSQGSPINGVVPVGDTMEDIIANTCGALLFAVHYIIHAVTKKNLGISSLVNDFSR